MKFLFLLLSLGLLVNMDAQTKQQPIAGTKYSLAPPAGFVPATGFSGFQHIEMGASIMLVVLEAAPYEETAGSFTAEALQAKGMTLLKKKDIVHNGSSALLLEVSQPAIGRVYLKQILIFGNAEQTVMVNGIYPG